MPRKQHTRSNGAMTKSKGLPIVGRKGGMAIAAGVTLGGLAGAAMGGMAGAMFANRSTREKVATAAGTAGKYATNAVEAVIENPDAYGLSSRGRKGGRAQSTSKKGSK